MRPLLSDLHVHTNFSDGRHSLREIVDFYGHLNFDVIAITDHSSDTNNIAGQVANFLNMSVNLQKQEIYFEALRKEAQRAWEKYNLLVLPGIEVTKNYLNQNRACHFLVIGEEEAIDAKEDILTLLTRFKKKNCLTIAAHPLSTGDWEFQSVSLWRDRELYKKYFDAWEVNTGPKYFDEVARSGLPILATSDLHTYRQINCWKTLLYTEKSREGVFSAVRSQKIQIVQYRNGEIGFTEQKELLYG